MLNVFRPFKNIYVYILFKHQKICIAKSGKKYIQVLVLNVWSGAYEHYYYGVIYILQIRLVILM